MLFCKDLKTSASLAVVLYSAEQPNPLQFRDRSSNHNKEVKQKSKLSMFELFGSMLDSPAACMRRPLSFESVDQILCCDNSLIQDFFIMKKNHLVPANLSFV